MSLIIREIISRLKPGLQVGHSNKAELLTKTAYVSGQIPLKPSDGQMVEGGVAEQAKQVLENVKAVVEAAGSSMGNVVKTTILLEDIKDWPAVNEVYATYFPEKYPARAAYQVSALPKGAKVEMEAIAVVGEICDVE